MKHLIIISLILLTIIVFTLKDPQILTFEDCKWEFTTIKPDYNDPNILMCVPAAYTSNNGQIIGHYSNSSKRLGKSDYRYTTINLDKGYFQQLTLVNNKVPKTIKDSKYRFRRALCKKGNTFYIENSKIPLTLSQFAKQLSKKYDFAWNLDMGTYSYGWYKKDNKIHHMGLSSFTNKNKQSNWIIVKKL